LAHAAATEKTFSMTGEVSPCSIRSAKTRSASASNARHGLFAGLSIDHGTRYLRDFGNPPALLLLLNFDSKRHYGKGQRKELNTQTQFGAIFRKSHFESEPIRKFCFVERRRAFARASRLRSRPITTRDGEAGFESGS